MTAIVPQPGIMDIALYQGGASHLPGQSDVLKLSSNENPYGPSPAAVAAYAEAAADLHRYPPTDHGALRAAIADVHGLDPERIICGVGSDEVLQFLSQAFAGPGTEVLYPEHGFSLYRLLALAVGATPLAVPERERVVDVKALIAACTERTRLIFLANPANPTGTMLDMAALERLADGVPSHVLVVLDGAYAEFASGYDGGAGLVEARANIVMTRTFSKLYGLGGLRVGWGYGPRAIIDVLNRIRQPFNLGLGQLAAAEAAVRDRAFVARCLAENARLRVQLARDLSGLGIPSDASSANFILGRFADETECAAADAHLQAHGILVRRVVGYGFPEALRITVGTEADCARVTVALARFREKAA